MAIVNAADLFAAIQTTEAPRRLFTVDEYYRMGEAGILAPNERVELIRGTIVSQARITPRHARCFNHLAEVCILSLHTHAILG